MAVDGQRNVYVTDFDNRRVQKFTSSGGFLLAWGMDVDSGGGTGAEVCRTATACKMGASGTGDGGFTLPGDVATDCANDVYVVDQGVSSGPVQKFDSNAAFLTRWGGTTGSGDGQFNQARGVDVARAANTALIADATNRRYQRFSLAGGFIDKWGSLGTGNGQFSAPYDVSFGTGGIYTSDSSLHRIQRFNEAAPHAGRRRGSRQGAECCPSFAGLHSAATIRGPKWVLEERRDRSFTRHQRQVLVPTSAACGAALVRTAGIARRGYRHTK